MRFKAVGGTPILKKNVFHLNCTDPWARITNFLRKKLHLGPDDELFCFLRSSFVPAPDEQLGQLLRCFELDGEVLVQYSKTKAWG